jgi:hypothetical protein
VIGVVVQVGQSALVGVAALRDLHPRTRRQCASDSSLPQRAVLAGAFVLAQYSARAADQTVACPARDCSPPQPAAHSWLEILLCSSVRVLPATPHAALVASPSTAAARPCPIFLAERTGQAVYLQALWFGVWVLLNSSRFRFRPFDPFPYSLLTLICGSVDGCGTLVDHGWKE